MAKKPAHKDPMGLFVRVYVEVLDSPSWLSLSLVSLRLYMAMRRKVNASGYNNGNIEATLTTLRTAGVTSSSSLAKALRELQAVGLIASTRKSVGVERGSNVCCLYRFTDLDCYAVPKLGIEAVAATHDWRRFKTSEQADAAIQAAESDAARRATERRSQKKAAVRKSHCADSKNELAAPATDSKTEQRPITPTRKKNRRDTPTKQACTPMEKGLQADPELHEEIILTTSKFEHLLTVASQGSKSNLGTLHV